MRDRFARIRQHAAKRQKGRQQNGAKTAPAALNSASGDGIGTRCMGHKLTPDFGGELTTKIRAVVDAGWTSRPAPDSYPQPDARRNPLTSFRIGPRFVNVTRRGEGGSLPAESAALRLGPDSINGVLFGLR